MIERGDCTGWIKWLEWDNNLEISWTDWEWKHKSSEISWALQNKWKARSERLRGAPVWTSIWHEEKKYDQHRKLEINTTGEETITKDDELEAREHLHEGSPDQNIDRKEWSDFTWINGYLIKDIWVLEEKGGRAGKTKATWDRWNKQRCETLELILRMGRMMGSSRREAHWLEKN